MHTLTRQRLSVRVRRAPRAGALGATIIASALGIASATHAQSSATSPAAGPPATKLSEPAAATPAVTAARTCLAPAAWTALAGEQAGVTAAEAVIADMAGREVVLLGENHDDDDHHRWQLQVLAALHVERPRMVIGFEAFPRRVQGALDRWVAGELTVAEFLAQSDWEEVWSLPAELYLPLFQFARINRIPMVALNVERTLTRTIADKGWDAVPDTQREGVGRPAAPSEAYRDVLFESYRAHATPGAKNAERRRSDRAFERFVESQAAWDRAMAEALARRAVAGPGGAKPLVVGIMGSGHLRHGHGVPHQLRDLGIRRIGTLLPVPAESDCGELRPGLADAVFALPKRAAVAPEPPRLGVRLEENDAGVRLAGVSAGSLAEASGLKAGDVLVEVAGAPVRRAAPVVASVRRQPPGTWLPIRVRRGGESIDVVVRFPARK